LHAPTLSYTRRVEPTVRELLRKHVFSPAHTMWLSPALRATIKSIMAMCGATRQRVARRAVSSTRCGSEPRHGHALGATLAADDAEAAVQFYAGILPEWKFRGVGGAGRGGGPKDQTFTVEGTGPSCSGAIRNRISSDDPFQRWIPTFAVDNALAAAGLCKAAGGTVAAAPSTKGEDAIRCVDPQVRVAAETPCQSSHAELASWCVGRRDLCDGGGGGGGGGGQRVRLFVLKQFARTPAVMWRAYGMAGWCIFPAAARCARREVDWAANLWRYQLAGQLRRPHYHRDWRSR
jgi:predicted enzyme related to lactoylglutathione lyase